ncbi:M23 family metallopeptidase [Pontixanthobacter aestiaquae]|nr:M23 family metallopeptidase [Pontixanthobacter aestiaquae]MDN3646932.1 M23 family metallopeptidase [Pontixanthobacter aestiaquae]
MVKNITADGWRNRLADWFPDREFFMRSQGQVRFIKVSSKVQKIAALVVLAALLAWGISMAVMAWAQYQAQAERSSLLEREARVATTQERIDAYSGDIDKVAADLAARQDFVEAAAAALPEDITDQSEADTVSDSASEATETVSKISALIPEAAALAELEARQLAFVERLTRFADRRAARAASAIRQLGLDPRAIEQSASQEAMGGPLNTLSTSADGNIDPRFERLGLSMARMAALERGLQGIPQVAPANPESISSGFGYRRDPFTRRGAMHSGLDFKGPRGAPIYSAAQGTVSYVGWKSGYGKTVEVSHGNGLMTRYAHMSRFAAAVGQDVAAGDVIGAIGNTGRSTGPHLHFEVRINGRAVNPRPFLEKAPHVLKKARAADAPRQPGE